MKPVKNPASDKTRRRFAFLRRMVDASQRTLANYTPAGPGSLATGQISAAGRGGTYVGLAPVDSVSSRSGSARHIWDLQCD